MQFEMQNKEVSSAKSLIILLITDRKKVLTSEALKVLLVIGMTWLTEELFDLKPVSQLFKRLFCIMKLKILSNTSFAKVLDCIGNTWIG